jgi:hypothetical protein
MSLGYRRRKVCQVASKWFTRLPFRERRSAYFQNGVVNQDINGTVQQVVTNCVAVFDAGNGTANRRFR